MKRIILATTAALLFTQPALAYSRLFYRFTVRSNYEKKPIYTDQPSTPAPAPMSSILPAEDGLVDEVEPGGEEENIGQVEEIVAEEPGVVNTPEGEDIASAIIGPVDDVELIEPSAQPSILPAVEENMVDEAADEGTEELGVENTPEEKREGQKIVVEEQSVGEDREEAEESATEEIEPAEPEQKITTPGEPESKEATKQQCKNT